MYEQSVLRQSGQWWKAVLFIGLVFGGAGVLLLGWRLITDSPPNTMPPAYVYWMLGGGFVVWFIGLVFGFTAIGCRNCDARWLWLLANGANGKPPVVWFSALMDKPDCPVCGAANGQKAT